MLSISAIDVRDSDTIHAYGAEVIIVRDAEAIIVHDVEAMDARSVEDSMQSIYIFIVV